MNLFELFVTIGAKDEVTDKVSGIKATTIAAGQLMANAAMATGKAIVNLSKQVVEGYAEYEQLTGGVETLFKTSSDAVMEYAENAYKSAGLSANEYMSTVTSFSASLLDSLGGDTEKAAEYADRAVVSMADNANKMGTDISMIQNAYQGFAKQNYTMLDNLKLGYGGTQQEMQRLIADAAAMTDVQEQLGITVDASSMSFDNIVNAIQVMQENMGIAGATAAEAEGTISGSVASMKAAWENLTVGFADENANIDELMDEFLASVGTVADNILPVVERILGNVFNSLADNAPEMLKKGVELFMQIAMGAIRAIPGIIKSIPEIVSAIADGFVDAWPEIVEIGKEIVKGLWEGIKSLAGWLGSKITGFFGNIVGDVKDLLGIHSPSRVFAGIGENMALGVGDGWESEFKSVRGDIASGLNFGTASVGYSESAIGKMQGALAGAGENNGDLVINITEQVGGATVARKQYRYNVAESKRHGVSLVNA